MPLIFIMMANSLKKAQIISLTVYSFLVFSLDTEIKYNLPQQKLTEYSSIIELYLFNSIHSSPSINNVSLNLECHLKLLLSSDFSLADRALSNDNMFSKFIQLSFLSYLSSVTVSHSNSLIMLTADSIINYDSSSLDDYSTCYNLFKEDTLLN